MANLIFALGAISGAVSVAFGAFGAHALRSRLPADRLNSLEIAVRYQMFHAIALVAVGLAVPRYASSDLVLASGWLFIVGTILFSGSLYILALTGKRWLGAITPLGGLALISGWLCLALGALR